MASSGPAGKQEFISHIFCLAKDVRMIYSRVDGDLEAAVPYYMCCVFSDCFQVYEEVGTSVAAASAVQTLVWRTGLLIGLLAADSDQLPMTNIEHIVSLVCLLVPAASAPDPTIVENYWRQQKFQIRREQMV